VTAASAGGAALGFRLADWVWRRWRHHAPPAVARWSKLLVGRPVKHRLMSGLGAHSV
jgi:hypothetical protein